MQKYVNLVDLVNTVPRFTCRNRRRYSWERASHTLEVIEFILSFASLTISLHGPAEHWMCPADVSVQALHCSMNGSFDHCFTARWAPYRSCTKKKVRTKLAPMHNGQVITAKRSMAKQELRAILAECPLPVLKWLYRLVPSTGAGTVSDWLA